MGIVYLNGRYLPQEEAVVSAMDRGFLFGDGVYEVIPVYHGKLFRFEHHIARLHRSLAAIQLSLTIELSQWHTILTNLLQQNLECGSNQSIYLQVTRGAHNFRNHAFPKEVSPTLFAFTTTLRTLPLEELSKGMRAITLNDTRWERCDIKSISLLANVLLYQEALNQGAVETLLIRNGKAVEGATSNLFIVKDGTIMTPPLSNYILGGVTRDLVIELALQSHTPLKECDISETQLHEADEVWITSSTREIYPIIQVDDTRVGEGQPGPAWRQMISLYHQFIKKI